MVSLEPFDNIYLEKSWEWLNDPEIKYLTDTPDFTKSDQQKWYSLVKNNPNYKLFGARIGTERIGVFGFKNINSETGEAEYFGYIGNKKYIGKGYGREILSRIIDFGNYELMLKKIYLLVIPENIKAIALYKKFGFSKIDVSENKIIMAKSLNKIELQRYDTQHKTEWNKFVQNSKNGLFLFDRNYMDYHKDRFPDHSMIFRRKQKIVAVFPATELGKTITSHSGLTFGSLIMDISLLASEVLTCFQEIKKYYSSNGFEEIIYKSIPSMFHKYPAEEDLYALFRNDAKLIRRDISSVISMDSAIRFSETKRQFVRKCGDLNIKITENNDFSQYWDLLESVLRKFDAKPVHTLDEIKLLKDNFPQKIRLFEARREQTLLAGLVIYDFGSVVHTQYMANSSEGRKIGALDYLNFKLINDVFNDRKSYSFGISTVDHGKILNEGLILQKELMGGRGIALDFYSINLIN